MLKFSMKRILVIAVYVFCLAGCTLGCSRNNDDAKKQIRIDIYSPQDEFLLVIDDQETIHDLLDDKNWTLVDHLPDNLTPEYKLCVYQQKTLLAGQNPDEERDYELIETITTFQDSSYVTEVIAGSVVKNMVLSDSVLTFYYEWTEDTIRQIQTLLIS